MNKDNRLNTRTNTAGKGESGGKHRHKDHHFILKEEGEMTESEGETELIQLQLNLSPAVLNPPAQFRHRHKNFIHADARV